MRWRGAIVGLVGVLLTACGGGGGSRLVLPPRPSTSSTEALAPTVPVTTSPSAPITAAPATAPAAPGPWEVATANLAGLASECGTVSLVAAQPGSDLVIAGAARQGLWSLSTDGTSWVQLADGNAISNRPIWIEWDADNPMQFWEAGTYGSGGVYRTTDGGASFRQLGDVVHVDTVSVDFTDPARRVLVAGQHETPKVWSSTDGGQRWKDITSNLPASSGHAFAPLVIGPSTYLLGTKAGEAAGIYRTSDGGASWTQVHTGEASSQPLQVADGTIYWSTASGLVVSTDQGQTWTAKPGPTAGSPSIIELPDGAIAAIREGRQIEVSSDQAATWRPLGPPMPYAPLGMTYSGAHQRFFIFRFDCADGTVPIGEDNIMSLQYPVG